MKQHSTKHAREGLEGELSDGSFNQPHKNGKKIELEKKYCGNCRYHETYKYPDLIFCFIRHSHNLDSVNPTLGCCKSWERKIQECFCLKEALKNMKRTY